MKWFDRIFTRRLDEPCYGGIPSQGRRHLALVCRRLSEAEEDAQKRLGLCVRPRLTLVDEQLAEIVTPWLRDEIEREHDQVGVAG
jgi:hypothetical protein